MKRGGKSSEGAAARGLDPSLLQAVLAQEPMLLGLARKLCGNAFDANDLVQDVLESALRSGERLAAVENLRAWLVKILSRRAVDLFRRGTHEVLSEELEEGAWLQPQPADEPAWARVTTEQLTAAVEKLEEPFRTAYRMAALEQRSYRDIAEALGIPGNTVGTRLYRARTQLRELLFGGRVEVEQ